MTLKYRQGYRHSYHPYRRPFVTEIWLVGTLQSSLPHREFAKFWTPNFDWTQDSMLKLNYASTGWDKKVNRKCLYITLPNIGRFSKFFYSYSLQKIAMQQSLNIPLKLRRVATLPCEIFVRKLAS